MIPLIHKCIANDRAAQKQLYLDHCDYLMGVVYRYVYDIDDAKDVLQNAFVRIFKNLEMYDAERASFQTWARSIAVNEALNYLRKRNRLQFDSLDKHDIAGSEYTLAKLNLMDVQNLIKELPTKYRSIINLYHFEEYSHDEIAKMLGITASSSRSQLSRAKKMLHLHYHNLNKVGNE